ncbi:MAG: hypothetical protein HYZ09_00840 [Candidatus Kerfeldbacteria bacterium]|nr:hypothetical protein [Candidatus Kerfeldbacteria bacterium]
MALHITTEQAPTGQTDPDRHERVRVDPFIQLRGSFEDRVAVSEAVGRVLGPLYCLYYLMLDGVIELSIESGQVTTEGKVTVYGQTDEYRLNETLDRIHRIARVVAEEYGELLALPLVLRAEYTCQFLTAPR